MVDFQNPYLTFLKQVLKHWPTDDEANEANLEKNMTGISEFIGNNFDQSELVVGIEGFKRVLKITPINDNSVIIIFLDKEDCPYKAIINRDSARFFLESIEHQCPVCFGDGVLEEENKNVECKVCGGTGWGA